VIQQRDGRFESTSNWERERERETEKNWEKQHHDGRLESTSLPLKTDWKPIGKQKKYNNARDGWLELMSIRGQTHAPLLLEIGSHPIIILKQK